MSSIDPSVITHRLNVHPSSKLVLQKKRVFAPERDNAIKEEVQKLTLAKFIREVYYLDWLANVVMVKKANEKWRMCVDFTDLNKACPKDSYPCLASTSWWILRRVIGYLALWTPFPDTIK